MLYSRISGEPLLPAELFAADISRSVCITGHRENGIIPYNGSTEAATAGVKRFLCRCIDMAAEAGYEYFFSGLASGTDLWAAEHVIKRRIDGAPVKLVGVVPYLRHADYFPERSRRLLGIIERNADHLLIVNSDPAVVFSRTPGAHTSPSLYRDRNYFMVDHSSAVIAFLNPETLHSGTGQTVSYAQRCGKRIVSFGCGDVLRALERAGGDPSAMDLDAVYPENMFEYPF